EATNKVQSIVEEARERREAAIESHADSAFEGGRNREAANGKADGPASEEADGGDDAQLTLADSDGDGSSDESPAGDGDDAASKEEDSGDRAEKAENDDAQSGLGDFT
ncbi:MAG: hypothetical protein V5A33_06895, partial [Halobacteriales archaeon]